MSRGVNKVILLGRLGKDPETHAFQNGGGVTNISLATEEQWKDKQSGETRKRTEWHRVSFFGRLGEIAAQYLQKGSQCYVEGRIQTRKWQGQDGQDRYSTEVVARELQLLGGGDGGNRPSDQGHNGGGGGSSWPAGGQSQPQQSPRNQPMRDDFEDDVPF